MDSGNKRRSGEMLTKQRCQVSFFSLDVPSVFLSFHCPLRLALSSDCFLSLCSMYYDIYVNKSRDPQTIFAKERKKGHLHFCQHIYFSFSQNIIVCIFGIFQ